MKTSNTPHAQFAKALEDLASIPLESFTSKLWDDLMRRFSDFTDELKIYFFYEEKNCRRYTMEEAAKWFKDNIRPGARLKGGIFKENLGPYRPIRLHLFFIDKERALIDGKHAHLFVNTQELEPFLLELFGEKQLIVIE